MLRNLNSDLALIDDKSDFSGSFVSPPHKQLQQKQKQSEQNQRFAGRAHLNQITMNGEEPKFMNAADNSPTKRKKLIRIAT